VRRAARPVQIGHVKVGGGGPPIIQSMTSVQTWNVNDTFRQTMDLHRLGAAMVRVAIPDQRSLNALPAVRGLLRSENAFFPLIGDIHYSLGLALGALRHVEKVRINPGNLLDRPRGSSVVPDRRATGDRARMNALRRIFAEAKRQHRAVRVGVNQGSLSQRIVAEHGVGVDALAASAMEYIGEARKNSFSELVVSLKSSNPWTVVAAHRALAEKDIDAPFHVGVTEAGWGLQGRSRSAAGIGILLREGLVDTLRVSLAEPPEGELPVAAALVSGARPLIVPGARLREGTVKGAQIRLTEMELRAWDGSSRARVTTGECMSSLVEIERPRRPMIDLCHPETPIPEGYDAVRIVGEPSSPNELADLIESRLCIGESEYEPALVQLPLPGNEAGGEDRLTEMLGRLDKELVWEADISDPGSSLRVYTDLAQLFEAGCLDYVELHTGYDPDTDYESSVDILQGMGTGSWCLEVIACPQCGRCRIDVPGLASHIRKTLGHMAGLKLAVMGCIVNGPGEMQDADFGCIGDGEGTVALYAHGRLVERGVAVELAGERLCELTSRDDTSISREVRR
jgi:(E)-4-hydroxy-3-methylbut-2-enyl-diphosphate synthase